MFFSYTIQQEFNLVIDELIFVLELPFLLVLSGIIVYWIFLKILQIPKKVCLFWIGYALYFITVVIFFLSMNGVFYGYLLDNLMLGTIFANMYYMKLDFLAKSLILLTSFLVPVCLLTDWPKITRQPFLFGSIFLITEFLLFGVFLTENILNFFIFFEIILIPFFLLIFFYGSRTRRVRAAYLFFIYTFAGSFCLLLGIAYIFLHYKTLSIAEISLIKFSKLEERFLWGLFFLSFATKMPLMPFHLWLPEAHVEAPTSGSIFLAGVLLKLGSFGFLRVLYPFFPNACLFFKPLIVILGLSGVIYIALTTIIQTDLKRVIAYSSVSHMSLLTLSIFSDNHFSLWASIFLMIAHGIVSGGLFYSVGILYDRYHTKLIPYYGGLSRYMPLFSVFFFAHVVSNMALPGTISFIAEFSALLAIFIDNLIVGILASVTMLLGAIYSIWVFNRICFGQPNLNYIHKFKDLSRREYNIYLLFVILILGYGFFPNGLLRFI